MFNKFFAWIRESTKHAILGGIQDAAEVIDAKAESRAIAHEPRLIEDQSAQPAKNGRRAARTR